MYTSEGNRLCSSTLKRSEATSVGSITAKSLRDQLIEVLPDTQAQMFVFIKKLVSGFPVIRTIERVNNS